ncbi:hypothetical protein Tco_0986067 [Tanacetum coccineum]
MQGVILFYNGVEVPTRQILNSKGTIPTMTAANVKIAIQEMVEHSQKWHNRGSTWIKNTTTFNGLATIQAQDFPLKEEGKTFEETYCMQFVASYQSGGQYMAEALGFCQRNNAILSYQERRQSME